MSPKRRRNQTLFLGNLPSPSRLPFSVKLRRLQHPTAGLCRPQPTKTGKHSLSMSKMPTASRKTQCRSATESNSSPPSFMLEGLRNGATRNHGPSWCFALPPKSEIPYAARPKKIGLRTSRPAWRPASRQKKNEEFLTDLESASDPAGTWRTIMSLFGAPASTIFTEPLLRKGRAFTTNESHNQRLQLSVACAEDYAAIVNGRKKLLCSLAKGGT